MTNYHIGPRKIPLNPQMYPKTQKCVGIGFKAKNRRSAVICTRLNSKSACAKVLVRHITNSVTWNVSSLWSILVVISNTVAAFAVIGRTMISAFIRASNGVRCLTPSALKEGCLRWYDTVAVLWKYSHCCGRFLGASECTSIGGPMWPDAVISHAALKVHVDRESTAVLGQL